MDFELVSDFKPTGDQPSAIKELVEGIQRGDENQVLLGVTGSGKTFTIANVIKQLQRPTLILSHNKTLAAQLYSEFKQFFPNNAVEYFISYYDYYQPEAYIPASNTYIEKDLSINDEIEKLRLRTTSSLISGRRDVIVVSSVSCLYGIGNPEDFNNGTIIMKVGESISRDMFLYKLVESLYSRNEISFSHGNFRVKGDTVDIFPGYSDFCIRIVFWGNEIEKIETFSHVTGQRTDSLREISIFPANIFVTSKDKIKEAIYRIQDDMFAQRDYFLEIGKPLEAKRLEDRTNYDIEMIKELGYCSGIENYSRYFDGRSAGSRPFCLIDFFPNDFLTVIDESHVTVSQVRAMYNGDRSRKTTLVDYGFRLPSALDNRPLKFDEFEGIIGQTVYMSATPADYELDKSGGVVVEQVIRPTGLLDPVIEVRPSRNEIDDLLDEIEKTVGRGFRVLVTTLTKKMAEELNTFLIRNGVRSKYIHSDVAALDRVQILQDLRLKVFDVLVGVNLLREGLDLPEVALVAILDADKEGFLRSERALTQTAGRAARNSESLVIMYADRVTNSMQRTIDETARRREKQIKYNTKHHIVPTQLNKAINSNDLSLKSNLEKDKRAYAEGMVEPISMAADPVVKYMSKEQLRKTITKTRKQMEAAAKEMDFIEAARLRDEILELETLLAGK